MTTDLRPRDTRLWISGASSGLGAALVASAPASVRSIRDLSRSGGASRTTHVKADLSTAAGWDIARSDFETTMDSLRRDSSADSGQSGPAPTVTLIHCAGRITPIGPAGSTDQAAYQAAVLLNAAAPLILGSAFLTAADATGLRAQIVMISSGAASSPYEGWSHYCAAKAGVDHWVRTVGAEQRRRGSGGARVLSIAPGVVDTPMQADIRAMEPSQFPAVQRFRELHARGELVSPETAAHGVWDALADDSVSTGAVTDLRSRI